MASTNPPTPARTWRNVGLQDTYHIGAVQIDPKNSDIVYVAALGHLWGPNEQRGVFRSTDGGKTWKQVLTRGPEAGAVDLAIDPANPNVIYAAFWQVSRKPWRLDSGGPGSGLWKSHRWRRHLDRHLRTPPACRTASLGRIGVTVSPVNPERVWAIVEAADGGVFRSDNGGRNWIRLDSGERPAPARLVLLPHLCRPQERRHRVRAQRRRFQIHRRRPHLRRHSARRTATITTCGSRPTIRAA